MTGLDNIFLLCIWCGLICLVLGAGAFICDVVVPRVVEWVRLPVIEIEED